MSLRMIISVLITEKGKNNVGIWAESHNSSKFDGLFSCSFGQKVGKPTFFTFLNPFYSERQTLGKLWTQFSRLHPQVIRLKWVKCEVTNPSHEPPPPPPPWLPESLRGSWCFQSAGSVALLSTPNSPRLSRSMFFTLQNSWLLVFWVIHRIITHKSATWARCTK